MTTSPRSRKPGFTTKSAEVRRRLARPRGASVAEIMAMTSWQNHSVRAFLTGLRKKGERLVREERPSGEAVYRLGQGDMAGQENINAEPR